MARWLYGCLEREYDYLQSEEMVDEAIVANAYTFTAAGEWFGVECRWCDSTGLLTRYKHHRGGRIGHFPCLDQPMTTVNTDMIFIVEGQDRDVDPLSPVCGRTLNINT